MWLQNLFDGCWEGNKQPILWNGFGLFCQEAKERPNDVWSAAQIEFTENWELALLRCKGQCYSYLGVQFRPSNGNGNEQLHIKFTGVNI